MKPRQRLLRTNPQTAGQENLSAVDLLLHLTCAADIAREEIYRPLRTRLVFRKASFPF